MRKSISIQAALIAASCGLAQVAPTSAAWSKTAEPTMPSIKLAADVKAPPATGAKSELEAFAGLMAIVNKNPNAAAKLDHVRIVSSDEDLIQNVEFDALNKYILTTCTTITTFFTNYKHGKPMGLGVTCSLMPTGHCLYELEVRPVERQDNKMAVSLTNTLEQIKVPPVSGPIKLQILLKVWFPRSDALAFFKKGFELEKAQKYKEAIEQFSQALTVDPGDTEAFTCRALAYNSLAQYDKAIADLTRAIGLGSRDAYVARAYSYRKLKQADNAMADCNREIELNPRYWEGYVSRAELWEDQGNHDAAIKDCDTALQYMAICGYAYLVRGQAHLNLKQTDEALRDLNMACEILPKSADAYHFRAQALKALGKDEDAANDDSRAATLGYKVQ